MRILGVDPGLKTTGYGLIEVVRPEGRDFRLIEAGVIEPRPKDPLPDRIKTVYTRMKEMIGQTRPAILVLEKLYAHYKHPVTACVLGHVRGVICLLCADALPGLVEYDVKRIRKALIGNGNASKPQIRDAVAHFLRIDPGRLTLDASDALALAMGYYFLEVSGKAIPN